MNRRAVGVFVAGLMVASRAFGATSTFTTNDEGWKIVSFGNLSTDSYSISGTYTPTYNATGGNPGGYISTQDPDSGDFTFSAPAAFLGNALGAYGTNLKYDLNYTTTVNYQTTDLVLTGSGTVTRLVYIPTTAFVPTTAFQTNTIPISATTGWHVNTTTGTQPTAAQFNDVLSNLTGLYIRGEYAVGPDNAGLDNVNFAVPEPASLVLIASAFGLMTRRRRA